MAADDRREMLIDATLPLVAEHGLKVTSKQIAEAAGVAEGTIFRVFHDKEALVTAAVDKALDPAPLMAALAGINAALPLRERLLEIVGIVQERFKTVFNLMIAVKMYGPPSAVDQCRHRAKNEAVLHEVVRLLEPDQASFRRPVAEVTHVLRLLTFAGSHPMITDGRLLTAEEIVDVLLDGTLQHQND